MLPHCFREKSYEAIMKWELAGDQNTCLNRIAVAADVQGQEKVAQTLALFD